MPGKMILQRCILIIAHRIQNAAREQLGFHENHGSIIHHWRTYVNGAPAATPPQRQFNQSNNPNNRTILLSPSPAVKDHPRRRSPDPALTIHQLTTTVHLHLKPSPYLPLYTYTFSLHLFLPRPVNRNLLQRPFSVLTASPPWDATLSPLAQESPISLSTFFPTLNSSLSTLNFFPSPPRQSRPLATSIAANRTNRPQSFVSCISDLLAIPD